MRKLSLLFASFVGIAAACGGKIDDGTDSGTDAAGTDSPPICKPNGSSCAIPPDCCTKVCSLGVCGLTATCTANFQTCTASAQCCSQICDPQSSVCLPFGAPPPPPNCEPDGSSCGNPAQCCSLVCGPNGLCGGPSPPPPPPCQPDGTKCSSPTQCCSSNCTNGTCGGVNVGCASTSPKVCDQCIDANCCPYLLACNGDSTCSQWESCVESCEKQGGTGSACAQTTCKGLADSTQAALYACGAQFCTQECLKD